MVFRLAGMPTFRIYVINSDFESSNHVDASDFHNARSQALRAALQIGVDEVCQGKHFFGAEIRVELDGKTERFMVGMGQTPLQ